MSNAMYMIKDQYEMSPGRVAGGEGSTAQPREG
jgi:hypothetical protein